MFQDGRFDYSSEGFKVDIRDQSIRIWHNGQPTVPKTHQKIVASAKYWNDKLRTLSTASHITQKKKSLLAANIKNAETNTDFLYIAKIGWVNRKDDHWSILCNDGVCVEFNENLNTVKWQTTAGIVSKNTEACEVVRRIEAAANYLGVTLS